MGLKDLKEKWFPSYSSDYDDTEAVEDDYQEEQEYTQEMSNHQEPKNKGAYGRPSEGSGVTMASRSSIEMKVVTPTKFEAVTQIADLLVDGKTVLLNLENTNKETAKRLIDFLSGVAYALNGEVQKVADNTFAVTPNNVAVSNESVDSYAEEPEEEF